MYDIIYGFVMPKWKWYLESKTEKNVKDINKLRQDTLWKKILRDVREFFRILFRVRFHFLEYKNQTRASLWVQILFDELGIPLTNEEIDDPNLFRFIHQTHKSKLITSSFYMINSPFEVIEKYNDFYKTLFMTNLTCARMLYFVFQNFLEEYCLQVKPRYRREVVTMICMVLNCYKRMNSSSHIKRIWFLLK